MITSNTALPGLGATDNPVVQRVIDTFYTTYTMVGSFIDNKESAIKGLLISGDAGTGKNTLGKKSIR
jgi:hypothetical protein